MSRPIHCAREWQKAARRLDKETKPANWHKTDPTQISAQLKVDPISGKLTAKQRDMQVVQENKWNVS